MRVDAVDGFHINDRLAAEAFQIVTEGLSNIRRHTDAKEAFIKLRHDGKKLFLEIVNNTDAPAAASDFTPKSIFGRVELLGRGARRTKSKSDESFRRNSSLTGEAAMPIFSNLVISILLVDDHKSFTDGLQMVIDSQKPAMEVVGTASTPADAVKTAVKLKPDLILLDMDLGDSLSLDFLPELLEKTESKVLMLTGLSNTDLHETALLKGARGILMKGEPALDFRAHCAVGSGYILP